MLRVGAILISKVLAHLNAITIFALNFWLERIVNEVVTLVAGSRNWLFV